MGGWRPTVGTVLLITHLVILLLPLGGVSVLRLYESVLIRQTETELIAQSAFVAASYRSALTRIDASRLRDPSYGRPIDTKHADAIADGQHWQPRPAVLDLASSPLLDEVASPMPVVDLAADPAAKLTGESLDPILRDAQKVTLAGIRVVDMNGIVVSSTGTDQGLSLMNREEVTRALDGEFVSVLRRREIIEPAPPIYSISRSTGLRVNVVTPILVDDRVIGAALFMRTPANITQALYGKRRELLIAAVVGLVVMALVVLFTAFMIRRPVRRLVSQARRVIAGQRGAVVPLTRPGTAEIGELSAAVSQLASTLEERADYIQDFANHVSHEFKAPVTSIRGAVELLAEHDATMSTEQRQQFLRNLNKDALRLQRLTAQLLNLARADVTKPGDSDTTWLAQVLDVIHRDQSVAVNVQWEDSEAQHACYVAMAAQTLNSVLTSLITNAGQHGARNIDLHVLEDADDVIITLSDDGEGIKVGNRERLFDPFFTTKRDKGGTGLGLAIVKSLIEAHQGEITILDKPPAHTSLDGAHFQLILPAAL